MDRAKVALLYIGIGITIGAVLTWLLIMVLGLKPKTVSLGPLQFDVPTASPVALAAEYTGQPVAQNEPRPTETRLPRALASVPPTNTPTAPSTSTPDPRLFWDDFESGVKPEWGMQGDYSTVNGRLVGQRATEGYVGDLSWTDYAVVLRGFEASCASVDIKLRMQDRDNYICLRTTFGCAGILQRWEWFRVVNGQEKEIPGTRAEQGTVSGGSLLRIEAQGSTYRLLLDGNRLIYFNDNTFTQGGIGLLNSADAPVAIDTLEVLPLP